jgi:hypothetical protein
MIFSLDIIIPLVGNILVLVSGNMKHHKSIKDLKFKRIVVV